GPFEGFGSRGGRRRRRDADEEERSFADFIQVMFGAGGGAAASPPRTARGEDIEHPIEVDFLDALRGTKMSISIRRPAACPQCGGTGRQGARAGTRCGGTGT